jgi:integrase
VERREAGRGAGVHALQAEFTFRTYCRQNGSNANRPDSRHDFRLARDPAVVPRPTRRVAVLTGMRIGEILALRWKRLDLRRATLEVAETFSEGEFGTPKTRSSYRVIPLSRLLTSVFETLRSKAPSSAPDDLVFMTPKGTPLSSKNLYNRELAPACDRIKQPRISWHSFRHTHATLLTETGESIKTTQALLGHSDLGTTLNTYSHVIPDSQRRAVEQVAGVLFSDVLRLDDSAKIERIN